VFELLWSERDTSRTPHGKVLQSVEGSACVDPRGPFNGTLVSTMTSENRLASWAALLALVTGQIDRQLQAQLEFVLAENRIGSGLRIGTRDLSGNLS
jgi:hypothetical protein